MKRSSLIVAAVLCWAVAAHASLIITESVGANVTKDNGTYTPITFKLTGLTGNDNLPYEANPAGLLLLDGTFTATNGGVMAVPGSGSSSDTGYWEDFITNGKYGLGTINSDGSDGSGFQFNYAASGVNFANTITNNTSRTGTGGSTLDDLGAVMTIQGNSASFSGDWFAISSANQLVAGTGASSILAKIYVTPGDDVIFSGAYGVESTSGGGLGGFGGSGAGAYTMNPVPEPGALGLLMLGVLPMLARRRRA